jgi:hypothetical protein
MNRDVPAGLLLFGCLILKEKAAAVFPAFLVILLVSGNIGVGGMETTGKIRQIKATENSLFCCSQTT